MPAITPDLLERVRGCLLGAAVGDAFGMALEGAPRQHVNHQVRELRRGRLPAGQFTASSGVMLTLADGLLAPQPLSAEELAGRIEDNQRSASARIGAQARTLLAFLGGPGERSPAEPVVDEAPTAVAPALTYCPPFALANTGNRFACLAQARDLTRIIHPHPECVAGGAFVAVVLWHLVQGMPARQAVQQGLRACEDLPQPLAETIARASTRMRDHLTNGELVQPMLESVVWGLLTTASFAEAVTRVTNLGGNAAVAGALVGTLAGAAYRHSGIPADWRAQVSGSWPPRGGRMWRQKDLVELAERLALA